MKKAKEAVKAALSSAANIVYKLATDTDDLVHLRVLIADSLESAKMAVEFLELAQKSARPKRPKVPTGLPLTKEGLVAFDKGRFNYLVSDKDYVQKNTPKINCAINWQHGFTTAMTRKRR